MMGLFKRSILGTYIETSDTELLNTYIQEIKNLALIGGRSNMTMVENLNFKVGCKYLVVRSDGKFWQTMGKPKGCRPIKRTAIK